MQRKAKKVNSCLLSLKAEVKVGIRAFCEVSLDG